MSSESHLVILAVLFCQLKVLLFIIVQIDRTLPIHYLRQTNFAFIHGAQQVLSIIIPTMSLAAQVSEVIWGNFYDDVFRRITCLSHVTKIRLYI